MYEACRLGVHQLPPGEAGLVRALVTLLGSGQPGFGWSFVTQAPYDALILDAASPAATDAAQRPAARAYAVAGDAPGVPAEFTRLRRPLRQEGLAPWLTEVRQALRPPQPAEPLPGTPSAEPAYRLKRWPPAELLQGNPGRVRLAAMLSRRSLRVSDLAAQTGEDLAKCQLFVQLLLGFGLLQVETGPTAPAPRSPAAASRAPAPAAAPSGMRRLVHGLRLRLGLL